MGFGTIQRIAKCATVRSRRINLLILSIGWLVCLDRNLKNKPYHQFDHNCFDFVIQFLNAIHFNGTNEHTKHSFVEQKVAPKVEEFEQFFTLYQGLQDKSSLIVDIAEKKEMWTKELKNKSKISSFASLEVCEIQQELLEQLYLLTKIDLSLFLAQSWSQ